MTSYRLTALAAVSGVNAASSLLETMAEAAKEPDQSWPERSRTVVTTSSQRGRVPDRGARG
jgi:hypothetical protein